MTFDTPLIVFASCSFAIGIGRLGDTRGITVTRLRGMTDTHTPIQTESAGRTGQALHCSDNSYRRFTTGNGVIHGPGNNGEARGGSPIVFSVLGFLGINGYQLYLRSSWRLLHCTAAIA